ncbi:MAG: thiamine phosphate synthase [Acidobacteria bacterium]|nr:thiamine phosphate synthase [Acidobacteriota bacterium]
MFLYYITDRKQLSADPRTSERLLLERIRAAAEAGVDAIQLRERDLGTRPLTELGLRVAEILESVSGPGARTRLLLNSRTDIAVACRADGVHLRSDDVTPADARAVLVAAGVERPIVGISCHTQREVELAAGHGADFCVFGPVFEKAGASSAGLEMLAQVCRQVKRAAGLFHVLALGGVTLENAAECLRAGAGGIAGIRLFQTGNMAEIVKRLRGQGTGGREVTGNR